GLRDDALRLLRRYAAEGRRQGYDACLRLLASVPEGSASDALGALDRGLAERSVAPGGMGMAGLFAAAAGPGRGGGPRRRVGRAPREMVEAIAAAWRADPADLLRLRLAMRASVAGAASAAIAGAGDPGAEPSRRVALLGLLAELGDADGV